MSKFAKVLILISCTAIGVTWGLVQVTPNIRKYELLPIVWIESFEKYSLIFGMLFFGILLIAIAIFSLEKFQIKEFVSEQFTKRCNSRTRRVRTHEIVKVHQLCVSAFGEDVANQNRMASWHKINDDIFYLVEGVNRGKKKKITEQIGYFDLLPLNAHGVTELTNNALNGTSILNSHISSPDENPAAVYIGGIYGEGFTGRGVALVHLRARLQQYERENGVTQFFTRPVTARGLKLVEQNDFFPIDESKKGIKALYKLSTKAAEDR